MKNFLKKFINKPIVYEEVVISCYNKLPDKIKVDWKRNGKYIVGKIQADEHEFYTQALSAKEFVDMVNEALFITYNIPEEYFDILEDKKFTPSPTEYNKLKNAAIQESIISFDKISVKAYA